MKKLNKILFYLLFFLMLCLINTKVSAFATTVENVILYMQKNNLMNDEEYFKIFGKMLDGNDSEGNTFESFRYSVIPSGKEIRIIADLGSKNQGKTITYETALTYDGDNIYYTNKNEKMDSLGSRVDALILTELLYSIGGARGYKPEVIVDWMNQIDLKKVTEEQGIKIDYEDVKFEKSEGNKKYTYTVTIPKSYTIDIGKITDTIPTIIDKKVEIKDIVPGMNEIKMTVNSNNFPGEQCNIYRKSDDGTKYQLVGTVSCQNGEFTDSKLKDDTTYTYQATLSNEIDCADDVEITTQKAPDTGGNFIFEIMTSLLLIGLLLLCYYKKHTKFRRI